MDQSSVVADSGINLTLQQSDNSYYINGAFVQSVNSPLIISTVDKLKPTAKKKFLPGDENPRYAGQCVVYVRYITGAQISGNAIEWKKYINSNTPVVGAVVVMRVGKFGHLGVVQNIQGDTVTIRSRNWDGLWIVSDDDFSVDDSRILGYINL